MLNHRRTTASLLLSSCFAAALAVTGCGTATPTADETVAALPDTTASQNPTASGTPARAVEAPTDVTEAFALFEACIAEQGIDLPDGLSGADGLDVEDGAGDAAMPTDEELALLEEAAKKCEGHLANVQDEFTLDAEQQAAFDDAAVAFRDCMIKEGVDPAVFDIDLDGDPTAGDAESIKLDEVDMDDFDAAMTVCGSVLEEVVESQVKDAS